MSRTLDCGLIDHLLAAPCMGLGARRTAARAAQRSMLFDGIMKALAQSLTHEGKDGISRGVGFTGNLRCVADSLAFDVRSVGTPPRPSPPRPSSPASRPPAGRGGRLKKQNLLLFHPLSPGRVGV